MSEFPPPELLEPQWFIPLFALMWFGINGLFSLLSGWWGLASRFPAEEDIEGERFRFVSGSMGLPFVPVNYGNCLFVTINDRGFRLGILFLFRFLSPPLFIPWASIESVVEKRFLLIRYTAIHIRENWRFTGRQVSASWRFMHDFSTNERSNNALLTDAYSSPLCAPCGAAKRER